MMTRVQAAMPDGYETSLLTNEESMAKKACLVLLGLPDRDTRQAR